MQFRFRRRAALIAPFLLLALAAAIPVAHVVAADATATYPVGIEACDDATKQLCTPIATVPVTTTSALQVEFTAAATHCSDAIAHLFVDGTERFVSSALAPGQGTGVQDFGPASAGSHDLGVQVEGVLGGCNVGGVSNWGGTLTVTVSTGPVTTPTAASASAPSPSAATSQSPTPSAVPAGTSDSTSTLWLLAFLGAGLLLFLWFILARRRRRDREDPDTPTDD
jgi:hypothetical protein